MKLCLWCNERKVSRDWLLRPTALCRPCRKQLADGVGVVPPESPAGVLHVVGAGRRDVVDSQMAPQLEVLIPSEVVPFVGMGERLRVVGISRRGRKLRLRFETQQVVP